MTKKIILSALVICVLVLLIALLWRSPITPPSSQTTNVPAPAAQRNEPAPNEKNKQAANGTNQQPTQLLQGEEMRKAQVKTEQEFTLKAALTPIAFYGKVIDEKNNPIAGANIKISPADHPFASGSEYNRNSDKDGLFSITGIHGIGLMVDVSKEGYYSIPESRGHFEYFSGAGGSPARTNPDNPAVFTLRKKGITEPLIVIEKDIKIDRKGTPVQIDFKTGRITTNGDIQVEAWTHDRDGGAFDPSKHYDWQCRVSVPGGGLTQRTGDEFNFEAPADGYQNDDTFNMTASDPNWSNTVSKEYYLKTPGGLYVRLNFTMRAGGDNFFTITSYLNPTPGDRNLEYDPAKRIKAK